MNKEPANLFSITSIFERLLCKKITFLTAPESF